MNEFLSLNDQDRILANHELAMLFVNLPYVNLDIIIDSVSLLPDKLYSIAKNICGSDTLKNKNIYLNKVQNLLQYSPEESCAFFKYTVNSSEVKWSPDIDLAINSVLSSPEYSFELSGLINKQHKNFSKLRVAACNDPYYATLFQLKYPHKSCIVAASKNLKRTFEAIMNYNDIVNDNNLVPILPLFINKPKYIYDILNEIIVWESCDLGYKKCIKYIRENFSNNREIKKLLKEMDEIF